MGLTITTDLRGLARLERRLTLAAGGAGVEVERAVISVSRATYTESKRAVTAVYNLPQKRVAGPLAVRVAGNRRGFVISGNPKPISFVSYGARALARGGVRVRIFRGRAQLVRGAFAADAPRAADAGEDTPGNRLFWIRTGQPKRVMTKGRYEGKRREPIRALTGPSVADHLNNPDVRGRIERFFVNRMSTELRRRLSRLLARR